MVKLYLNLVPTRVTYNTNILKAAQKLFLNIPRFCYHMSLNIAGNCRICLVEVNRSPKPVPACALAVSKSIKVYTYSPIVKKAQEAVVEFLLINHPLDCPICDQGGICDLQDQAIKFGNKLSRFYIKKRGVEDKSMSLLVKSIISRCIHCTRCVRFAYLANSHAAIGTSLRGVLSQIGTYVKNIFHNELSMSIVELCPVGGLSKPKKGKPLEFQKRQFLALQTILNEVVKGHKARPSSPLKGITGSHFKRILVDFKILAKILKSVTVDKKWG